MRAKQTHDRSMWRRLVVLALSVLLLSGVSPTAVVAQRAPQLVASSAVELFRSHVQSGASDRHLRRDDGRHATSRDARPTFPTLHVLPSFGAPSIAQSAELARLAIERPVHRTLESLPLPPTRARGPPSFIDIV